MLLIFLDKFHLEKLAFIAFGYGKYNTKNKKMFQNHTINGVTFYKKVMNILYKNNIGLAINCLKNFMINSSTDISESKKIEILNFMKYVVANRSGISNYQNDNCFGSRIEAFISHYIKRKTTKKFSLFSHDCFKNILKNQENENLKYIFV